MISFVVALAALAQPPAAPTIADRVGVTHAAGSYHLTDQPFLDEGADVIEGLGARVLKVYLTLDDNGPVTKSYPFNMEWPACRSLAELADSAPFRRLFARPFSTFILTTYRPGKPAQYWHQSLTPEDEADEARAIEELSRYFLTTYRDRVVTFVIQHWEGDWSVRGSYDAKADPSPAEFERMTRWLQARQRGVDRARAAVADSKARVLHAVEVNLVLPTLRDHRPGVIDQVVPRVAPDLVSYSAWEAQDDPATLRRALDFMAARTPDKPPFGDRNVYIGEFGKPENDFPPDRVRQVIATALDTGLDWGCPYVVYWQLYCNEPRRRPAREASDVRGFWLIRPDGSKGLAWPILAERLATGATPSRPRIAP
jgi:hypothetical protein